MDLSPEKVWKSCLDFIKDNINEQSYETWFLPIKPIKLKKLLEIIQFTLGKKFTY